jgi:CRISPR-associated endoribonuclease Cas6
MRFELELYRKNGNVLPINYKYELSAWIYKTLYTANKEFADWLHKEGYPYNNKRFKLFTFSDLRLYNFKARGDRLHLSASTTHLTVSFCINKAVQHFLQGIFANQHLGIGDKISQIDFEVRSVQSLPLPDFNNEMKFRALSPICVSTGETENGKFRQKFLPPDHPQYAEILFANLERKMAAGMASGGIEKIGFGNTTTKNFELLSEPKRKKITIKAHTAQKSDVVAYQFDFAIKAPAQLLEIGYKAGFGEKNSLGFGCVDLLKQ